MEPLTFTDEELIQQTRDGLRSGFESLVRRYHARCVRIARGMLKNEEDAKEAVQDAFLRAYTGIAAYRGEAKFSTWLYRILYNVCCTRLRTRKEYVDLSAVEDRYEERLLQASPAVEETEYAADTDIAEKVRDVLRTLPERYQTVLTLYYFEEQSVGEICRILNVNQSNVKIRLYRGRIVLRNELVKRFGKEIMV